MIAENMIAEDILTTEERGAIAANINSVVRGDRLTVGAAQAAGALSVLLALLIEAGAEGEPEVDIDVMATAIGRMIASTAHRFRGDLDARSLGRTDA